MPIDVGRLVIVFDRPMRMGLWTLQQADGAAFPPLAEMARPWRDERTFVLPLKTLAPNTTYAVQLNGARRQGFVSTEGAALPVTVVRFTTGDGRPGWRIVNVADAFIAYHDRCANASAPERAALWDTMLESRYPVFFRDAIYRRKSGPERERYKAACRRRFWRDVAPRMDAIRRVNSTIAADLRRMAARFGALFPDYRPSTGCYATISLSFRGKALSVGGRTVLALGLEYFTGGQPEIDITIAHELFHLYHFRHFRASGGLYRTLWAEGLASYASGRIVPGYSMREYLGFPPAKMSRCRELLPELARDLRRRLGENDRRISRIYFGAEDNDTAVPPEAGYYVGYRVVERLAQDRSLAELARMDAKTAFGVLAQALDRLARDR